MMQQQQQQKHHHVVLQVQVVQVVQEQVRYVQVV